MRKTLIGRLIAIVLLWNVSLLVHAQSITINSNFNTGSYGAGGGITVPVSLGSGCFLPGNSFQLYLSDALGNFSPGTLIGTYNGFFTPFVNGIIPGGTAPGSGYKVKVVSTSPAGVQVISNAFSIVSTATTPVSNPTTGQSGLTFNDTTFGKCQISSNSTLSLTVGVPAGKTMTATVFKNSTTISASPTVTSGGLNFSMVPGNYYTVEITIKNSDNSISVKSFLVLANTSNLSLQTSGANEICLPDLKTYTVNTSAGGGIGNNYPGTTYTINWGDGSTSTYTHCQLIDSGGNVSHVYNTTSCGRPAITDINPPQYNAYKVNITAENEYCPNSFTPITSYAKVWSRPIADFVSPLFGCLNTPITFTNTSQSGLAGTNNAINCTNSSTYEWYVDGVFASSATTLVYSFPTTGNHTVQLIAINDPCNDDTLKTICIEPVPNPNFKLNGQDVLSGCTGLVADVTNTSSLTNTCRPYTFVWSVVKVPGPAVLNTDYTQVPNPTDSTPRFTFLTPGTYYVRLSVSNSCGNFFDEDTVIIKQNAVVTLPSNKRYCDLRTINFATDANHTPGYNTNAGTETYQWSVTGGTANITTPSSAYPTIQFLQYGTYTIQVIFNNDCGADTATQQIIFDQPTTVNAGSDATVCFDVVSSQLNGSSTGAAGYTATWSAIAPAVIGNLSATNIPNPVYTFSATDKSNGSVRLIYTATPPAGSSCPPVKDTVVITIRPDNQITTFTPKTICSGTNVNYVLSSQQLASTLNWTSSVISGTVTGNTNGNGSPINDVLVNSSNTVDAVVRYTVSATKNGCTGPSKDIDITVKPLPQLTATPSSINICSGQSLTINLGSTVSGSTFSWTSSFTGGTISGNTSSSTTGASFLNTLTNNGTTDVTLTYHVKVNGPSPSSCLGDSTDITVTVKPGVSAANAGADQKLCNLTAATLSGNNPVVGTGTWTQITGPNTATITNASQNNTTVTGLITGTYQFVWTISGSAGGCPDSKDTVSIINRAAITTANAGPNQVLCDFVVGVTNTVTLAGNAPANPFENGTWSFVGAANGATINAPTSPSSTVTFVSPGTYQLQWSISNDASSCPASTSTVTIKVYAKPVGGTLASSANVCEGSNNGTINLTGYTGVILKWQLSTDGGGTWNDIANTTSSLTYTNLITTTIYRVVIGSAGAADGCGTTVNSNTVTITVSPLPSVSPETATVCSGSAFSITPSTAPAGTTYTWTAPTGSGFTGGSAQATPVTSISQTLTNTTNSPATATYTVTPKLGNCAGSPFTVTITINPKAVVTNSPLNQTICSNTASALVSFTSSTAAANTVFNWTGTTGNGITGFTASGSGDLNPMTLVNPNNTQGSVVYTVTPVYTNNAVACPGTPATYTIFVNPRPTATATPSLQTICSGTATGIALTSNVAGTTFSWTVSANGSITGAATGSGSTIAQNLSNSSTTDQTITYTITPTYTNGVGCAGTPITVDITVKPTPDVTITPGPQTICSGTNSALVTLSSAVSGATFNWSATATAGTTGFTASQNNTTTIPAQQLFNSTTSPGTVTYSITPLTGGSGACAGSSVTYTITVNPAPNVIFTPTTETICSGSTTSAVALSSTTPGATFSWTANANGATGVTPSGTGNIGSQIITNSTNAPISVVYTATASTSGSTACPGSPTDYTIVVNPIPNAVATPASQTICSNSSTSIALSSVVSGTTFSWTVSSNSNITGAAIGSGSTISQTLTNTSTTPQDITYTIKPTYTNAGRSCDGNTITVTITVNPKATVTNSPLNQVICSNTSTALVSFTSSTAAANTVFNWTGTTGNGISGFTASGSGDLNPMTLVNPNNTQGSVVYTVTPVYTNNAVACPGTPATYTIFVNPRPTATATPSLQTICSGTATGIALTSNVTGTTFSWTVSVNGNITGAAAGSGNSIAQSLSNSSTTDQTITYTITPTYTNGVGCAGTPITVDITVKPTPDVTITPGPQTICSGSTSAVVTLSSAVSGATFDWTATSTAGITGVGANQSNTTTIPAMTLLNSTNSPGIVTFTITPKTTGGGACAGSSVSYTITVNPAPNVSFNPTAETICSGSATTAVTLSSTTPGATFSWTSAANGAGGVTPSGTGNIPSQTITNNTNASINVVYTATASTSGSTSCPGTPTNYTVVVNPIPNAIATPTGQTICSNTSTSIALSSAVSGTTFSWTVSSNGNITGAANGSGNTISQSLINTSTTPQDIIYTIKPTYTNAGKSCDGNTITVTITVNPTAVVTNSPLNQTICSNTASALVSFTSSTASASTVFNWTGTTANGITGYSTSGNGDLGAMTLVNPNNTQGSVVYTVTPVYTNNAVACPGTPATYTVFVNPTPNVILPPTQTICSGSNSTNAPLNSNVAGTTFSWTAVASSSSVTGFTATASGVNSIAPQTISNSSNTAQTVTYTITPIANGCTGATANYIITINPTPGITLPPNQTICSGGTSSLVNLVSDVAGATFNWTATPSSGAISGYTPAASNVTSIPPQTIFNNGATPGTVVYSITAITGGSTACPGAAVPYTITINPSPVVNFSLADQTTCSGSASAPVNISSTTPGAIISWTSVANGAGGVIANGSNSIPAQTLTNTTNAPITVSYTASATTNDPAACPGPSKVYNIVVNPVPNVVATPSSASICTNTATNISLSSFVPGAIFSWTVTVTGGITGSSNGTGNSIVQTLVNNGVNPETATYTITPSFSNNGTTCTGSPLTVVVTVNPVAAITNAPLSQTVCTNTATAPITWTSFTAGTSYSWTASSSGGITGFPANGTGDLPSMTLVNPGGAQGTVTILVTSTANLCSGPPTPYIITVNPDAKAAITIIKDSACAPFVIDNANGVKPVLYPSQNSNYSWYANGVFYGNSVNANPGFTLNNPGDSVTIKMVAISRYGCKNDSVEHKFFTVPRPATDFTASDTVGCGPLSVLFTNTTPNVNWFNYFWDFGNGQTFTGAQPGTKVFQPNPTYGDTTYKVTLTAFTQCDTVTLSRNIRVKSKPKALFTPDKTYGCSPLTVDFVNTSKGLNMTYRWEFGDGTFFNTSNNANVQHTYHTGQQDTFHVKLIATNECGSDTATYAIVVAARTINLNFTVNGNEITGCSPHTVRFINNSTGATNFNWDFGDGNIRSTIKNVDTVTHIYTAVGTFVATVKASNGCTDTTGSITIKVFRKPIPDFTVHPLPACVGDTLQFTNQTDTATSLLWNFGNGVTSQLTNPQYAYNTPGVYEVKLIAVRQYGPGNACIDSIPKMVTVVASLPGIFTVSDSVSTCVPFTVVFSNQSLPSSLTTWNFGDGGVDTGDIVSHTFTQVGTYQVTMTARDLGGCKYIAQKQIIVNGPAGAFIYDHGYVCGNAPVRFEATVTGTDSIRWNFGDGASLTTTSHVVYHVYTNPGNYVPTARLLAGATCSKLLQGADTIKVDYVDAGFKSNAVKICGSTNVSFTDTSRAYFGLQSWQWNFGDGNNSIVRNPVHTYTTTNTWPVQLIVTGISGCADTANVPLFIKVDSKPIANIDAPPTGCVNQPVLYTAIVTSPDPVTYYSWVFSNGSTGNTPTVNNNYAAAGTFNATLIVGTSFGCYDTTNKGITINPSPFVTTNVDMQICRGQSAQLNATGGLTYQWAPFTGLSCNTCSNPIASPLTTTQYVVTGFNSYGCAGRDTILITVPQPIDVLATASTVMCIGDSVQLNAMGATSYTWSPATGLSCTTCPAPVAKPAVTTVYRVIGKDAYNCFHDTAYVTIGVGNYPVVNVGPDKIFATGTEYPLAPTATNGPIAIWTWTPGNDLSCVTCPSPVVTAKKDICYTVTATNFFGCSGKDTMCIKVFCESSQLFIPNAFTPDGDGINDLLVVRAKGVKMVKSFRIFNRWGQVVFEKSNFAPNTDSYGWNGKVAGIAAPPDVYVYTCEVICEDDTPYTYKGNVAIIK